ncbi:Hypothetical_protein [Hexamita inflata]|uniref:Hypothetical_protein n=1 Tax=Hexamita inflata TaxID=28002 RepID=A0AA86QMK6_9EUKA|nr:Hypothetical protein HINF_LOCUS44302 [Hexamita inflata]
MQMKFQTSNLKCVLFFFTPQYDVIIFIACNSSHFWDLRRRQGYNNACYATCPGKMLLSNMSCVTTCPTSNPLIFNKSCVVSCPTRYTAGANKVCAQNKSGQTIGIVTSVIVGAVVIIALAIGTFVFLKKQKHGRKSMKLQVKLDTATIYA